MFPKEIQYVISNYQIFGVIPLDKTLHFLVGAIITVVLRWRKVSIQNTFIILAFIEITKEIIDSKTLQSSIHEEVMDFIATFIYPAILYCVIAFKKAKSK